MRYFMICFVFEQCEYFLQLELILVQTSHNSQAPQPHMTRV